MKLKKLMAVLVAVAMLGALTITASAAITNGNGPEIGEGASKYYFDLDKDTALTVTGFTISFNADLDGIEEEGIGGGVTAKSAEWVGWIEWGNEDAGKPLTTDGKTLTVTSEDGSPLFIDDGDKEADTFIVMIEGWWGVDLEITGITYTYAGGGDSAPADDNNASDSETQSIVPINADIGGDKVKDGADTGIADVAVASAIALAAAGAVIVTRKRK